MNQHSFMHSFFLYKKKNQSLPVKLSRDIKTEALESFGLPKFSQWVDMTIQTSSFWFHILSTVVWDQVTRILVSITIYTAAHFAIFRWQKKEELNLWFSHIQNFWKTLHVPATFPTVFRREVLFLAFIFLLILPNDVWELGSERI